MTFPKVIQILGKV